jgi:hypothetical protein
MPCFKPIEAWRQPGGEITFHDKGAGRPIKLPCGQCTGCRLKRSQEWALRCIHEASLHSKNCFVTLTYNQENLPRNGSLNPKDFVNFMKRLRIDQVPKNPFDKEKESYSHEDFRLKNGIRFYQAGEYGDNNNRPHHHAILFNYCPDDMVGIPCSKTNKEIFFSPYLEKIWGKGFVNVGEVNIKSAGYVARYCMKKISGLGADIINEVTGLKHYERFCDITGEIIEVLPEYSTMSRRPGIGSNWIHTYKSDVYPKDFVTVAGRPTRPPRYYDKYLKDTDPDLYDYLKACREEDAYLSPDNTIDRLKQRETCANARLQQLKRSL